MLTHFLSSQPALIKLDNENIGGHLTPLHTFPCGKNFVPEASTLLYRMAFVISAF